MADIETIIIVMMENRSFDHMLGYLSLPGYSRDEVDGLKLKPESTPQTPIWEPEFIVAGPYTPFRLPDPRAPFPQKMDPPHERPDIKVQLGTLKDDKYPMKGFVLSYPQTINVDGQDQPIVMGYFTGQDLPTTHFFQDNFLICDAWFSSLPAGTQPNRLLAMSGESRIDLNVNSTLPDQPLVYDWLTARNVKWRVYSESIPFFSLMPSQWPAIFNGQNYRQFTNLAFDILNEDAATFPQVIFVEPRYTNAPHIDPPHDDHAPSAVDPGQRFLMEVYAAITANPARWSKSVMIVTYDEHGGFFDHVSPPEIPTTAPNGEYPAFTSLGVRVPAYIISPWVEPRSVLHHALDHTAILQYLGEQFNGGHYSPAVDARMDAGLDSFSAALSLLEARPEIPPPPGITPGANTQAAPFDAMSQAFAAAFNGMRAANEAEVRKRFPKLFAHF
jgi:phospholipase C